MMDKKSNLSFEKILWAFLFSRMIISDLIEGNVVRIELKGTSSSCESKWNYEARKILSSHFQDVGD